MSNVCINLIYYFDPTITNNEFQRDDSLLCVGQVDVRCQRVIQATQQCVRAAGETLGPGEHGTTFTGGAGAHREGQGKQLFKL